MFEGMKNFINLVALPLVAGVFFISAIFKSISPYETLRTMRYLTVIDSEMLARLCVICLVCVEWLTTCLLLQQRTRRIGAFLTLALGALFTISICILVFGNAPVGCGCGIGPSKDVDLASLVRPGIVLAMGAGGVLATRKNLVAPAYLDMHPTD